MIKKFTVFCSIGIFSCTKQEDHSELNPTEDRINISVEESIDFDSIKPLQLEHPTDSTFDFNSVNVDTSMFEAEKNLSELKKELEKDPENSFLRNKINQMENDLKLSKQIYHEIKERKLQE